jgi:hypothetical protein
MPTVPYCTVLHVDTLLYYCDINQRLVESVNGAVELLGYTSVDPSSRLVRCQARSQKYKSCSRAALLPSKVLRGAGDISSRNLVQPRTGAGGLIFFLVRLAIVLKCLIALWVQLPLPSLLSVRCNREEPTGCLDQCHIPGLTLSRTRPPTSVCQSG